MGTVSIEFITSFLGRGVLSASRVPSVISFPSWPRRKAGTQEDETTIVGFSQSRCRYLTLVIASVCHATFFVIMGSKSGFPSMLVAYAVSAFSRSFILGRLLFRLPISSSTHNLFSYAVRP